MLTRRGAGYANERCVLVMVTRGVSWLCLREVCAGYAYEKSVLVMLTRGVCWLC